jgi:hypothetical protein
MYDRYKIETRITFTGVDRYTDFERLKDLNREYGFINIEWAFLFSPKHNGNRYWKEADIDGIIKHRTIDGPWMAAHLCGDYAYQFFLGHSINDFEKFRRIQLNFSYKNNKYNEQDFLNNLKNYKNNEFILQYNKSSQGHVYKYKDLPNVAILFDASGGHGKSPTAWPKPLCDKKWYSYAGGLGPHNIVEEIQRINAVAMEDAPLYVDDGLFGIDMESGVRTDYIDYYSRNAKVDDRFDLDKVESVLKQIADKFCNDHTA